MRLLFFDSGVCLVSWVISNLSFCMCVAHFLHNLMYICFTENRGNFLLGISMNDFTADSNANVNSAFLPWLYILPEQSSYCPHKFLAGSSPLKQTKSLCSTLYETILPSGTECYFIKQGKKYLNYIKMSFWEIKKQCKGFMEISKLKMSTFDIKHKICSISFLETEVWSLLT